MNIQRSKWLLLFFFLVVLVLPVYYSAEPCWDVIWCHNSGELPPGYIVHTGGVSDPGEYCTIININPESSPTLYLEIEVIYGSYNSQSYTTIHSQESPDNVLYFYLDKSTSPITVNCHALYPSDGHGSTPQRGYLLQHISFSYDKLYQTYINYSGIEPNTIPTSLTNSGLVRRYQTLPANLSNPFILGLGYFLLTIGLFLSFSFIFMLFKR